MSNVILGSADGTPWPVLRVSGRQVIFGRDVEIFAHIIAPDGKIRVGVGGLYDGTMCARDLRGATQVVWTCTDPGS